MQLISFHHGIGHHVGILLPDGERVIDLTAAGIVTDMLDLIEHYQHLSPQIRHEVEAEKAVRSLADLRLAAPIPEPRRNIFCIGKNYSEHAREFGRSGFDSGSLGGAEIPDHPIVFTKPPSTVIGPGDPIPAHLDPTNSVDYEGEIAVIIGRRGRVADTDDPMSFVFGYTIVNDVTSRELQKRHKQWVLGKGIDGFCPMGPCIVTADAFPDPAGVRLRTFVDDEPRQDTTFDHLIFDVPTLIRTIGRSTTLLPGDIIATGTPVGVGIGLNPPRFLTEGSVVRVEATGIGCLENRVA